MRPKRIQYSNTMLYTKRSCLGHCGALRCTCSVDKLLVKQCMPVLYYDSDLSSCTKVKLKLVEEEAEVALNLSFEIAHNVS